ncbi:hypothetical protein [Inconstantimicrobium mannanitabidum]|uniref:Uncharacterized protein n=1 Tax=Inconstantimicrobium mannanitabidum TaxID=1604901 RepID=A0ACB5RB90_9CLOT|nr:hypothetical protein [Clostridium sp. TW13]GKX66458.1 hypothetical protein rsdtw13_17160 [Clostridium sp. TW13]
MNKEKLIFVYVILLLIFSFINILVTIDVLPYEMWRICLLAATVVNLIITLISYKIQNLSAKSKKAIIIVATTIVVWTITLFVAFFTHI